MAGGGNTTKRDAPGSRQAVDVDLVNQMLVALQIIAAQRKAEQEEQQYWDQVETPPPEAYVEPDGVPGSSLPPGAAQSEADRSSAGRRSTETSPQRPSRYDTATSTTSFQPSSSPHPSRHAGGCPSSFHPAPSDLGSHHSDGGGHAAGSYRSGSCRSGGRGGSSAGGAGGSGRSYGGGGSSGYYGGNGGNRAEGSRMGIRCYCITKGRAVGVFYGWSNVAPLVNNISGAIQAGYPTFTTALNAFMEAANRGAVELVLP